MIKLPGYDISPDSESIRGCRIYHAIRESDKLPVVIKTHTNDHPSNSEVTHLLREYEIGRQLTHPNVVRYLALERLGHGVAVIEEVAGAIGLDQWLEEHRPTIDQFINIASQLVNAVSAIHQQHIIHKDIKPSNIVINPKTGNVKIIDFGLATLLHQETKELTAPGHIEGSLPYISPEQSGRMNRALDYRSDFYSLGVTFYLMLTGQLPFDDVDPLALIHSKIARIPPSPHSLREQAPKALSNIIMKLMANTAEERYQSATGLKADLIECQQTIKQQQPNNFNLGCHDYYEQFQLPQKLYGREHEIQQLLVLFDSVSNGASELLMVAGYSGIGKTSLVNEIHKPVTQRRGYFISGKFDQLNRNTAYSAVIQAFQSLINQLLGESENELAIWRSKILKMVGPNAHVLIDVIPEVEIVTGPQPEADALGPAETQQRFYNVFRDFLALFATANHPLVIFLDDLQWVDSGSMTLLEKLINDSELHHLFIIGAYRDNEVNPNHQLMVGLDELRQKGGNFLTLLLPPLRLPAIEQYLTDTLHDHSEAVKPLTKLINAKTGGNPFFMNQFMSTLYEDGLLTHQPGSSLWQWNIDDITACDYTDNIIDFVIANQERLPVDTQTALQYAACIGNQFLVSKLALALDVSDREADQSMWPAVRKGLVIPIDQFEERAHSGLHVTAFSVSTKAPYEKYRFIHDRVQQAAYYSIPENDRKPLHLKIGRHLLRELGQEYSGNLLFEIVDHFNIANELIDHACERQQLCKLNLEAGRKAQHNSAFKIAIFYFNAGIQFLQKDAWQTNYRICYDLHYEKAHSKLSIGDPEIEIEQMLKHAKTKLDRIKLYCLKCSQVERGGDPEKTIECAVIALNELGIEFPHKPNATDILHEQLRTKRLTAGKNIDDFFNIKVVSDEETKLAIATLKICASCGYMNAQVNMIHFVGYKMVNFSLTHGNTPKSAYGYTWLGMVLAMNNRYSEAYAYSTLAMRLSEKLPDLASQAETLFSHVVNISWINEPLTDIRMQLKKSSSMAYQSGDLFNSSWAAANIMIFSAYLPISVAMQDDEEAFKTIKRANYDYVIGFNMPHHLMLLQLKNTINHSFPYLDGVNTKTEMVNWLNDNDHKMGLFIFHNSEMILNYILGDVGAAQKSSQLAIDRIGAMPGTIPEVECLFFTLLTNLECGFIQSKSQHSFSHDDFMFQLNKIRSLAGHCPHNFKHMKMMIEGEIARASNEYDHAIRLFEIAIESARNGENIRDEGIANELLAKAYLDMGHPKIAAMYIQEACYVFERWEACTKLKQLNEKYAELLRSYPPPKTPGSQSLVDSSKSRGDMLDLATIVKTSQSTFSEIELDTLLNNLIQNIVENAGAQKGGILLAEEDALRLKAFTTDSSASSPQEKNNQTTVVLDAGGHSNNEKVIDHHMARQVFRTDNEVVIDDAMNCTELSHDEYVQLHKPRSILCMPIRYKGNVKGVLYLENNLTSAAFNKERIAVLDVLLSQAAISIENAKLFEENNKAEEEKRMLVAQVQHSQKLESLGLLAGGIAHDFNNLLCAIVGNAELAACKLDSESPVVKNIKDIQKAAQHATTFTSQMLAYAGRGKLKIESVDLNKMINELCHLLSSSATRKVKIDYLLNELPKIQADVSQVQQVVMNLVTNAADAIRDKSGKAGSITITTTVGNYDTDYLINTYLRTPLPAGEYVCLKVQDTGCGMTQITIDKLFDPFFTTKPNGRGLGMAAILGIVRGHKGAISINSKLNKGTTFKVLFPVMKAS